MVPLRTKSDRLQWDGDKVSAYQLQAWLKEIPPDSAIEIEIDEAMITTLTAIWDPALEKKS